MRSDPVVPSDAGYYLMYDVILTAAGALVPGDGFAKLTVDDMDIGGCGNTIVRSSRKWPIFMSQEAAVGCVPVYYNCDALNLVRFILHARVPTIAAGVNEPKNKLVRAESVCDEIERTVLPLCIRRLRGH